MKLAEALSERKAIKTKMEELKKRIYQSAKIQEGDTPAEDVLVLLEKLAAATEQFELLIGRINRTNNTVLLAEGLSLMEAIVKKDMLHYLHMIHSNLADKATPILERHNVREIKFVPAVNVGALRDKADEIAKQYRLLDMRIQQANWMHDLI